MRPSGLVVFDNVLWNGQVIEPSNQTDDTKALRELNDFIASDTRVEAVMVAVADGLTIARKRGRDEH
jgi:caffeoyl-CoA O-methyltransferase